MAATPACTGAQAWAGPRFEAFAPSANQAAPFAGAVGVRIEPAWWIVPAVGQWVMSSIQSSSATLKELNVSTGRADSAGLSATLASFNLNLTSITFVDCVRLAPGVFGACPSATSVLQVDYLSDHDPLSLSTTFSPAVDELLVVSKGNIIKGAPFLEACLNAPAAASLKRITIEGGWAKTFALTRGWREFVPKAQLAGVSVTLIDTSDIKGRGQREVVAAV